MNLNPHGLKLIVDVGIMDESRPVRKNSPAGKLSDCFVGVFDSAFDSVTKARIPCASTNGQSAKLEPKAIGAHHIDDLAAVVFAQLGTDFRREVRNLSGNRFVP
jgi:hypothetical protein